MELKYIATAPAAITALDNALPNVGVTQVLESANHAMGACDSGEVASLPISPNATRSMCWDTGDDTTTAWNPQGITSSGDADDDGAWGVNKVLLTGWNFTSGGRRNDARISFIDYNDPANPKYRWVYLVDPNGTGSNFTAAKAHVGGMLWYGNKLLVSAVGNTGVAIRVFDMEHILQMTDGSATIGKNSNGWAAYGYQYVMPEIGRYEYTAPARWTPTPEPPAFRPFRWIAAPARTASSPPSTSATGRAAGCWALHPEALTYWESQGLVWSLTEAPNQRTIFAVPRTELP